MRRQLSACVGIVLLLTTSAWAQLASQTALVGTVTDSGGSVIPGAQVVAVNVWPTCAVPEIVGTELFVGTMSMTELVAALVAGVLEPEPFVAVTEMVRVFPTSADTGT